MKRFIFVALTLATRSVWAAAPTDVADAFDSYERGGVRHSNLWDVNLRLWFDKQTASGTITREPVNRSSVDTGCSSGSIRNCVPLDEVSWNFHVYWVKMEAEFGLYKDLSLTVGTGYAISMKYQYQYADGIDAPISSVDREDGQYFELGGDGTTSKQKGWGALDFTLRYAILNEDRDDTLPTWVVGLGLSTPWISKTYHPGVDEATPRVPAGVGDGMYRVLFSTAFSKRMFTFDAVDFDPHGDRFGYIDPYFTLTYALPFASGKAPEELKGSTPFGHGPSHTIEARGGLEIVPYTDTRALRKIAFSFGGISRYVGSGRNYSILTPALKELTYTQEYFDVGGQAAIMVQVSAFVHVSLGVSLIYTTEHLLTNESPGTDSDGDGDIDVPNPYYCGNSADLCTPSSSTNDLTYDSPGTRFRDAGHFTTDWFGNVAFTF